VNTKQRVPPQAQIALVAIGILLAAALGWFALVHPKNSSAGKLSKEIVDSQTRLTQLQAAAAAAKHDKPVRVANLFRLVKAMPDSQDMSGILLELNQVAKDSGITFESIKPSTMVPLGAYQAVPITLAFTGNFYDLSDFLLRLRTLVSVRHGALDATGRLFAVDTLTFGPATGGFPIISASLTVDAFIYGAGAAASTPAATPPPATTDTTSTDAGAASDAAAGAAP
jgi:Pilus assembly protein, PilO